MADLIDKPFFYFTGMLVIDLSIDLGKMISLTIDKTISMETDFAIDFFKLSL